MVESESESRSVLSDSFQPHGLYIYSPWNSPGQNTGVGTLSLLHGIFPTQGSKPGLLHSGWILYQLSHKGSPSVVKPLTKNHTMSVWLQNSLPKLLRRHPPTALYFTEKKKKKTEVWTLSPPFGNFLPQLREASISPPLCSQALWFHRLPFTGAFLTSTFSLHHQLPVGNFLSAIPQKLW